MDKGEIYIKMSDCPEIQQNWQRDVGDWFYAKEDLGDRNDRSFIRKGTITCSGDIADYCWASSCDFGGGIENYKDAIWLPTQSQLQEMVGQSNIEYLLLDFHKFVAPDDYCLHGDREVGFYHQGYCEICTDQRNEVHRQFTSMEQLWLAFVMKEKFGKVWTGEKWI